MTCLEWVSRHMFGMRYGLLDSKQAGRAWAGYLAMTESRTRSWYRLGNGRLGI